MAMVIFTVLNGMGVVFLLYVLVQFWKEGHRSKRGATSHHAIEFWNQNRPDVLVVTRLISGGLQVADAPMPALWRRSVEPAPVSGGLPFVTQGKQVEPTPVSHSAQAGPSVIPMQARERSLQGNQFSGGLQVADAPKPALWRRSVEPGPGHRDSGDRVEETPLKRFSSR